MAGTSRLGKQLAEIVSVLGPIEAPDSDRDPFEVLDDLMVVVEALCPIWPDRPTYRDSTCFLL